MEVASRYLPAGAQAGVGGDWFDVIPLSGARVALVVGDVVGHGIHAAATMGRLRTAVRTLADIDLPPDELLTHLDDLVVRLSADEDGDGRRTRTPRPPEASAPPACTRSTTRSPGAARWPAPATRRPPWSAPTAPSTSPTCRPGRRSAWAACPSRPPRSTARGQPARPLHRRPGRGPRPRHRRRASTGCARPSPSPAATPGRRCATAVLDAAAARQPRRRRRPALARTRALDADQVADLGPARRPRRRRRGPRAATDQLERLGAGRRRLHHRTGRQRTGHQRHPLRPTAHPAAADPRPAP